MNKPENVTGRTQKQRAESTKTIVLDATLDCIEKHGYVMTSIGRIIEISGVSRGGLMHHYPSKQKLVAAAFIRFHQKRAARLEQLILSNDGKTLPFRKRIGIFRKEIEDWFPISIEFLIASMKDKDLDAAFSEQIDAYLEPMQESYDTLFPEFSNSESTYPKDLMLIMGCFMRGLCIDGVSNPNLQEQDKLFELFVSLIEKALTDFEKAAQKFK